MLTPPPRFPAARSTERWRRPAHLGLLTDRITVAKLHNATCCFSPYSVEEVGSGAIGTHLRIADEQVRLLHHAGARLCSGVVLVILRRFWARRRGGTRLSLRWDRAGASSPASGCVRLHGLIRTGICSTRLCEGRPMTRDYVDRPSRRSRVRLSSAPSRMI